MSLVKRAKLSTKGQITIPLEVRKRLKLREGDILQFEINQAGEVTLRPERPKDPLSRWAGAWREGEGLSLNEILTREREERGW
jgi:antitoxin PrlF